MSKVRIIQVKSVIDRSVSQKKTMVALGLTRMHRAIEVEATPQILGMINQVSHLIKVENI